MSIILLSFLAIALGFIAAFVMTVTILVVKVVASRKARTESTTPIEGLLISLVVSGIVTILPLALLPIIPAAIFAATAIVTVGPFKRAVLVALKSQNPELYDELK